jgi:GntR family transcriptional regulator
MYIVVDETDRRPIYQQVVDEIKALIARGELREGAALPPVRQVAADLGVNLNTIATAYRELQREGLINVRHGSGAVVSSRTAQEKSDGELRKPLRAALTQLVLAGLPKTEIMAIVSDELRGLLKGAK